MDRRSAAQDALIRAAHTADAIAIARLHRRARTTAMPYLPALHTPEEDLAFFRDRVLPTSMVWVAEQDGRVIGFCAVRDGWLDHLYVDPAHQRRGIGTALLARAQQRQARLQLWAFQRNAAARRFYVARGFREVELTDGSRNEEGEPDVRLEWVRPAATRWALLVEYDGAPFVGWQRQANGLSVQQVLEEAASRLQGGASVSTIVAGRTDAGVHAEGQVVQLELAREIDAEKLREALNYHTKPHPVVVLQAAPAPPGWNARFSAIGRAYRYRILNRRARPALKAGQVWYVPRALDAAAMAEAARHLLGRHDFTSFRASECQAKSPLRTLDRLDVIRHGELIEIIAEARSFLHHQVRNMVGTLKLVGEGSWRPDDVAAALAARDRSKAGPTAPPDGLCLTAVRYRDDPFNRAGS